VEGRTHQFAFTLFASVSIHLHDVDDSIVFGEVFALGHVETVGTEGAGRQQPNAAKVGRQYAPESKGGPHDLPGETSWLVC
jgi:hypothetical protein